MLALRITVLFTILFFYSSLALSQDIDVEIEELLTLGNDENASEEYLFIFPQHICTDKKINIYISDKNMCKIKIFDQNGKYIKSIGHRGQGPGEMQEITCFTIDKNDDVIVVDRMNMRFTKFINQGDSSICYPFLSKNYIDPWKIRTFGDNSFIIEYLDRNLSFLRNRTYSDRDQIIHIYNHDFSEITESVIKANEIWDLNDPLFSTEPGGSFSTQIDVFHSEKILISPYFYSGTFYLFEKIGNQWLKKYLNGIQIKGKPYELFDRYPNVKNIENLPVGYFSKSGQDYRFSGIKLNVSRGVFFTKDDLILNFTARLNKKNKRFIYGIEFYNAIGKFLGFGQLSNTKKGYEKFLRKLIIRWKDKEDRFYTVSENDEGFRIVRVLKFKYTIN